MGCATSLVKYIVFLFNLAFVLAAIAFIAVGVVFKLNIEELTTALDNTGIPFSLAPSLLIAVGCVIFVISFFGCCGAVKESTCMLKMYAIILLTIFILQIALGIYSFIQFKDSDSSISDEIDKNLKHTLELYTQDKAAKETIDLLQSELQCCGVSGPLDYVNIFHNGTVPSTCCEDRSEFCNPITAYKKGCGDDLYEFLKKSIDVIGIVVVVIASTELIGGIIALCLSSSISNYKRRNDYA